MEEHGEDLTPFWMQSTTNRRRPDRIRNGLSSLFFSSGLLIILLMLMAVSFLVFVVPSTLSFSTQIFKPNSVKKSWDSINIVLVLVALIFGFLSRATTNQDGNNDEYNHPTTSSVSTNETRKSNPSNPSTPQGKWYGYSANEARRSTFQEQWYGYSDGDRLAYNNSTITSSRGGGLRRSSSSYPDLLVEASPRFMSGSGDDPWRFYDDTGVDTYQVSDETGQIVRRRSWKDRFEDARVAETKNIYVDTPVNRHKEASNAPRPRPRSPTPPPPPPPPSLPLPSSSSLPKDKPKRAYRSVGHKGEGRSKRKGNNELEDKETISLPVTPPPPPPPPAPALPQFVDQKSSKTDKKRSGGNSSKDFWNTLYHKKKKKQRQKSIENFDALLHQPQTPPLRFEFPQSYRPPPPPPPPPPPLPPPSVFHNLFSTKKSKRRRPEQDISSTKPSSSQPIPASATHHPAEPSTCQFIPVTVQKSPKPIKIRSFDSVEENSNSGGESPVIPIPPPPPPPPPFAKSLSWKFVMQGDYVRVDSSISSRSGSTDMDETESDSTPTAIDGADVTTPLFFPSPDVNTKAENFITNFRAGLKLEKINSMNTRQGLGMSNLGRVSDSTQL